MTVLAEGPGNRIASVANPRRLHLASMFEIGTFMQFSSDWQGLICRELPEMLYRPRVERDDLRERERRAVRPHQALLAAINSGELPLSPSLIAELCRQRRHEVIFKGFIQTMKDLRLVVDVVSRLDRTDTSTATAEHQSVIATHSAMPIARSLFHDVSGIEYAGDELVWRNGQAGIEQSEIDASCQRQLFVVSPTLNRHKRATDWLQNVPVQHWVTWVTKLEASVLYRPLNRYDFLTAPADGHMRMTVLSHQALAALAVRVEHLHGIKGDRFLNQTA